MMGLADKKLKMGIAALKKGRKGEALAHLKDAVRLDPSNYKAWHWLSRAVEDKERKKACLKKALEISLRSTLAIQELQALDDPRGATAHETLTQTMDGQSAGLKRCPYPAEEIQAEAILCRYCGSDLDTKENEFKVTPGVALVLSICGFLILSGLSAPEAWGTTLPWVGFWVAQFLAFLALVVAVAQGNL